MVAALIIEESIFRVHLRRPAPVVPVPRACVTVTWAVGIAWLRASGAAHSSSGSQVGQSGPGLSQDCVWMCGSMCGHSDASGQWSGGSARQYAHCGQRYRLGIR
jgi:hypothetical protein